MDRTTQYSILIFRTSEGYQAVAPAFPHLRAVGKGSRVAYAHLKALINGEVLKHLANGEALPRENLVQTRMLRLDLWYLDSQEELR